MATADSSLETQIDCFLEQFKRSASKALEERAVIAGSRSSYLDVETPEEPLPCCEEFEMQNTVSLEPLGVNDVADILQHQCAIISGGKADDGCPIITFPDNNNFQMLSDLEYQRLMLYLTSVPSLQEADLGFHLIIDRRKDRWNSVKAALLKISVYFPGLIHIVYVLRPASFIQKALSEVSNKLFKDEFKFRMIVLSSTEELHEYISPKQLTADLNGTLPYNHDEWIEQRVQLEKFSGITQQVATALDEFTKSIDEVELPNDVDSTQQLLNSQTDSYSKLKEEIIEAAKHGEVLLHSIKEKSSVNEEYIDCNDTVGNVFAVERLLVQLEETEKTFDEFWQHHSTKLRHCLELRQFEQEFRELQINFDSHLKTVSEMTEVGETVTRIDTLIKETAAFEKICMADVERAEEVVSSGQHLLTIKNSCPLECVEPKCGELLRMKNMLMDRLSRRIDSLSKCRGLMERIEQANQWCSTGLDLLASQKIEQCSYLPDLADKYLSEIEEFVKSSKEFTSDQKDFKDIFQDSITPETKALASQVLQRIEDVSLMCNKRVLSLNRIAVKSKRPVQTVIPEPAVPRQTSLGMPAPNKVPIKKANTLPKMDSASIEQDREVNVLQVEANISPETDEVSKIKTGHVLAELLKTERVYVSELESIIRGYKTDALHEFHHLLPPNALDKFEVIFGNLDQIFSFHSNVFLRDLENCVTSTDLVALCFVQKKEHFNRLYSCYCQNLSKSEEAREHSHDLQPYFQACQKRIGHKLPLAAYLLKPVQRITKYQLLLRDLLNNSNEDKCCRELQQALNCMLVVLKCVNDSMHQISITGFPVDLSQQGELLLQGAFNIWVKHNKDLKLRLKPLRRHLFLYQKALLFCKPVSKRERNKEMYQFKHYLKMSQIGLTESVKGDPKKFEIWLQGRQEVHVIQAGTVDQKNAWVNEIKKVLFNQLEEIKGEKIKQYNATATHRPLRQTTSWETKKNVPVVPVMHSDHPRALSCDSEPNSQTTEEENSNDGTEGGNWSTDYESDDEETAAQRGRYLALADYCAVGNSEINMREGDIVELLKVGCAGWWFVKFVGSSVEGWAPAAYLESLTRKSSRSSSRSQDRLNEC